MSTNLNNEANAKVVGLNEENIQHIEANGKVDVNDGLNEENKGNVDIPDVFYTNT